MNKDITLPPISLLKKSAVASPLTKEAKAEMETIQQTIVKTLKSFHICVVPADITRGASITRYEFIPSEGLRLRRIVSLHAELKLATSVRFVHFLTPVPGKRTVGIELPNREADTITLRELLEECKSAPTPKMHLPIALGKDVEGKVHFADLAALPHLLVAGCPGSGKSVFLHSALLSLLMKLRPEELRLILIDPLKVKMQPYRMLPHLACPLITEAGRAIRALRWAEQEMQRRYLLLRTLEMQDIANYNAHAKESMPYIVILISEIADLMMEAKDELEDIVARLTQKAREVGIHLIIATQVPRAAVLTAKIKKHIPCRLALRVASPLDSRIILGSCGAEELLGQGDCLFLPPGGLPHQVRAQAAFVSDTEVNAVVQHLVRHAPQSFVQELLDSLDKGNDSERGDNAMLYLVAREGDVPCVQFLLAEGANANGGREDGWTPLHDAADLNHADCVRLLLEAGAEHSIQDSRGETPLHWAARKSANECARLLLEAGASPNIPDKHRGETPLHGAAWGGNVEIGRMLLTHGADVHARDEEGRSPLHRAAREGRADYAKLLLEHGAPVDATDDAGWTPLCWALRRKHDDCVALLLQHGAAPCPPEKAHQEEAVDKEERVQRAFFQGIPAFIRWMKKHSSSH